MLRVGTMVNQSYFMLFRCRNFSEVLWLTMVQRHSRVLFLGCFSIRNMPLLPSDFRPLLRRSMQWMRLFLKKLSHCCRFVGQLLERCWRFLRSQEEQSIKANVTKGIMEIIVFDREDLKICGITLSSWWRLMAPFGQKRQEMHEDGRACQHMRHHCEALDACNHAASFFFEKN